MKKNNFFVLLALCTVSTMLCSCGTGVNSSSDDVSGSDNTAQTTNNPAVASPDETAAPQDVLEDGMTAVYGTDLKDGVYSVQVDSSSSMFCITECELTVKDGEMTAAMKMGGTGYLYVYMGTAQAAAEANPNSYLSFVENADGTHTFTVPVAALDAGIDCAAFSKNKEKWYDRTLVFRADSLPADAFVKDQSTSIEDLALQDGDYLVAVTLEGGSGKASVHSPAKLTVESGTATAEIIWSSSNYDYMKVDGVQYDPINTEGNSVFEIPVSGFDYKMPVSADTTVMSTPHEIEYTLYFDSTTIEKQ
ncbi:MAG: hypothetical protein MRZ94_06505 [Oscillospiraceae bacterium]|nr:hypothetical protein [Oscillospiraceae bacterium]